MNRVLLAGGGTGGHLMPALALAETLQATGDVEVVLVGAERGVERELLPTRAFRYYLLPTHPIYRSAWWRNTRWLTAFPKLVGAANAILREEQPAVVVSTGGYAAGPIVWLAARRGIPTVLQEQNAFPGIATRWLARKADQIHLGFPEARRMLKTRGSAQIFESGNPIVPPPTPRPNKRLARRALGIEEDGPVVFVTGGSQGARSINRAIAEAIDLDGLRGVTLLWGVGKDHWESFRSYHRPPECLVRGFWDPISDAYAAADLMVGRAGAMTTAELCAWGLPALCVPLPHAAADHQTTNAKALVEAGAAVLLPESLVSGARLAAAVRQLIGDRGALQKMAGAALARSRPDASEVITGHILSLIR